MVFARSWLPIMHDKVWEVHTNPVCAHNICSEVVVINNHHYESISAWTCTDWREVVLEHQTFFPLDCQVGHFYFTVDSGPWFHLFKIVQYTTSALKCMKQFCPHVPSSLSSGAALANVLLSSAKNLVMSDQQAIVSLNLRCFKLHLHLVREDN